MNPETFLMKLFFLLFTALFHLSSGAASVDTVKIFSRAMNKERKCVVIIPSSSAQPQKKFPVVYLLHGYGGGYGNWLLRVPEIKNHADSYQVVIVCPDGDTSSWYFDSPIDPAMKYETYISTEVPDYIEAHYPVIKNRKARAITGLSMGGHGALFIGLRHADYFGACGSMSGLMDLGQARNSFALSKRIGDTLRYADNWKKYSVLEMVEHYPKDSLAIIFDCGQDDFLFAANRRMHEKMVKLKIPHDYIERPGTHNWAYWANAVKFQLLFFRNYFGKIE